MKTIFIVLFAFMLFGCGSSTNDSNEIAFPKGFEWAIIEEEPDYHLKRTNVSVSLNMKVNEPILKRVANQIKSERTFFDLVWIFYYLSETKGPYAWATSHFSPELSVKILGLSNEEEEKLAVVNENPGSLVGRWQASFLGAVIIIHKKEDGRYFLQTNYKDGSSNEETVTKILRDGKTTFNKNNQFGEFYVVERNGHLSLYDSEGKIGDATKFN